MKDSYFFDKKDHLLLEMINKTIEAADSTSIAKAAIATTMHPQGIQNLTNSQVARMAFAVVNLLSNLNGSTTSEERLAALKMLREEVMHSAQTTFRFNTARVLIQIMKEIVRAKGNEEKQLELIHDFGIVAAGNPRVVRQFLNKYYLLEMPEEWNQKTMDDHVHDSSTQGRKNATYLIMDAWVKGIRRLMVVYHNYTEPHVVAELLEAAEIMDIKVRIGFKYLTIFNGKYIPFLWTPRGFQGVDGFLDFINSPRTQVLMNMGREADEWNQRRVYNFLDKYNKVHAEEIAKRYGIEPVFLDRVQFADFLGRGQGSLLRLAEFAHKVTLPALKAKADEIKAQIPNAEGDEKARLGSELTELDALTPAAFYENWICSAKNPDLPTVRIPADDDRPAILKSQLPVFIDKIATLRAGSRLTLVLKGLTEADVLEILWDGKGIITDLEIFNMKDWQQGDLQRIKEINEVQKAVNSGNVIVLKSIIRRLLKESEIVSDPERTKKFNEILQNIPTLIDYYKRSGVGSRIGTDSTGYLGLRYGMGLVIPETLPRTARKIVEKRQNGFAPFTLPIHYSLSIVDKYKSKKEVGGFTNWVRNTLGFKKFGTEKTCEWKGGENNVSVSDKGNVITLGGVVDLPKNGFVESAAAKKASTKKSPKYLNTTYLNILKVCIGFFPAFITFMITQDWWFLAWFGAIIWFSITGIRNIIQAIIAGAGLTKNTIVSWKELINWTRVSESLMYTGMSVVLLEGLTRNGLLGHVLGITVDTMPLVVFTIIAIANGLYISSHNIFRGFPKTAVIGNFFRSILAIPVAMVYNMGLGVILPVLTGLPAETMLVPAAAIVSKFASDTVAGVIEATADRRNNYRLRGTDYKERIRSLFNCFTKMELTFPKKNVLTLMDDPAEFNKICGEKNKSVEIEAITISLDLMYFWFYKPCAQQTLTAKVKRMSPEEKEVFYKFQTVLEDHREVAKLFLDGVLGDNFSKALAFYLDNYKKYLESMKKLVALPADAPALPAPQKTETAMLPVKAEPAEG